MVSATDTMTLKRVSELAYSDKIINVILFLSGVLIPRMLGQRITQGDKPHRNSVTVHQFFLRYPLLKEYFLKHLQDASRKIKESMFLPTLVPILTLLSKLRAEHADNCDSR